MEFTPLAWEGDPVPGHEQLTISSLEGRSLNDAGQVLLDIAAVGPAPGDARRDALLVTGPSGLRTVVIGGEPAPLPGYTYGYGFSTSAINGRGEVAFASNITDGIAWTTAIWSEGLGGLHLVAKDGDQAPGLAPGQSFGFIGSGSSNVVINEAGQVAFIADYGGRSYGTGIWAEDRFGELQLIARVGQQVELTPGDVRSITELTFVGNSGLEDGYGASFNNLGQVAFGAHLSGGGSAVFVSNLVAAPEPPTVALAISVGIALCYGSRNPAYPRHKPSC
jgi:hypothetical protein